jgi:hypothetical protein
MSYIITGVVSLTVAVLAFILQSVIRENRELRKSHEACKTQRQEALENGVLCLLRAELMEYHSKYTERQSVTSHGLQVWLQMYKAYKDLGGNGMVEHMREEIEELHIKNN